MFFGRFPASFLQGPAYMMNMSKIIIIPDVHGRPFWRNAIKGHEEDRIVFLGDYLDPYAWEGITPEEAYEGLLDIIALKKAHPDNVTLLLGNHDLGYLDQSICTCRMDWRRKTDIRNVLLENLDLFDLVHIEPAEGMDLLFSHAGISEKWAREYGSLFGEGPFDPLSLNRALHDEEARPALFRSLSCVSWSRGGLDDFGSPVWADVNDYLDGDRLLGGYLHLFGHTLHDGGPINVRDQGLCLDCAEAFVLPGKDYPTMEK